VHTILLGLLVVGGSALLAVAGLWLVRRLLPSEIQDRTHQVAGFFIGAMGTMYSVLLAFVVSVLWTQLQDARVLVTKEANQIGDLSRLAKGFAEPVQSQIRQKLIVYTEVVLDDEWPAMAHGRDSQRAWAALHDLWTIFRKVEPKSVGEAALYTQCLVQMTNLSDSRRLRLLAGQGKVPLVLWFLLWIGAATTIVFTYFLAAASIRSQLVMTAGIPA